MDTREPTTPPPFPVPLPGLAAPTDPRNTTAAAPQTAPEGSVQSPSPTRNPTQTQLAAEPQAHAPTTGFEQHRTRRVSPPRLITISPISERAPLPPETTTQGTTTQGTLISEKEKAEGGDYATSSTGSKRRSSNNAPLPPLPLSVYLPGVGDERIPDPLHSPRRRSTMRTGTGAAGGGGGGNRSIVDYIVPTVQDEIHRPKTVGQRLEATLKYAREEREKYAIKAKMTGWSLNAAIGLQVLLGAMITALAAVTSGKQTSIMTSILGGASTCVASFLARARGSKEPELSIARVKDLDMFIRECEAFETDCGHHEGPMYDDKLNYLRKKFEELLGHASGERKLDSPV